MTPDQKRKKLLLLQMQAQARTQSSPRPAPEGQAATGQDPLAAFLDTGQEIPGSRQVSADGATAAEREIASDTFAARAAGPRTGLSLKAAQGIPLVGEWLDEGVGMIDPQQGAQMRAIQRGTEEIMPKAAMAAEIGGGIAASAPFAVGLAGKALQGGTRAAQVLRGAGAAAAAGGIEGAVAGAGAANEGNRAAGALFGGTLGAGLGGIVGGLAPIVGDAAKSVAQRVKKLDVRTIMDEMGVSAPAARRVKAALVNDDLGEAAARIQKIGPDAMLADAGYATGQTLDDAMATGGKALRVAQERISDRAGQAGTRLNSTLDRVLGPADGIKAAARDISQRTASVRQAAYDRAYSAPIDYAAQTGRNIEGVLSRIPSGTLRSAINEANDAMRAAGVTNRQIMAEIADDGTVMFREMPNVQQLDEIKKALGAIGREGIDQFGRPTAAGARANRLAGDLRDAISDAVPSYSRAVKLGGDKIAEDQALDIGRKLLSRSTTFEDARTALSGASREAKDAAKRGLRENIENTLSNVRRTITDPNTDAREAMQLVKDLSSRANEKKVRLLLGSESKALFDELERAEAALALRAAVSRNSATAVRTAGREAIQSEIQPSFLRRTLGKAGNPLDATREITETLAGIDPRSMSQAEQTIMAEISDALTRIRGPQAEAAIRAIDRAMQGQPLKDAEAAAIGRLVGGSASALGYQAGVQSLEP